MRVYLSLLYTLTAVVAFLSPDLSPRRVLFGIPVSREFRATRAARRSVIEFRLVICAAFIAGLLISTLAPLSPGWLFTPPLFLCLAAGAMFFWQNRKLKSFAQLTPAQQPHLELSTEPDHLPRIAWLSLLPFSLLLAAALYLHANWYRMPERFPVHWSAAGLPNRWGQRTPRGAYWSLVFAALFVGWLLLLNLVLWHGARRSRQRSYLFQVLTATQCLFGFVSSVIALAPLLHLSPQVQAFAVFAPVFGTVLFALRGALQSSSKPELEEMPKSSGTGGFWYYSREDPALAVLRRDGLGCVPNLAHFSIWLILVAPLLIILIGVKWIF